MKFAYVLPDPGNYHDWSEFDADLRAMKQCGYDAVEIQIADPELLNEARLRASLSAAGLPLCAFQTGGTYATRGNCLCTADDDVRLRTIALLKSFVDLAGRMKSVVVFGSLQGRAKDEPDIVAGRRRIVEAMTEVCRYADTKDVIIAFEPVNHLETAHHNTIAEVERRVRGLGLNSARMMIDSFHMNIEEKDMLAPLTGIMDRLVHVHLSETNRDVLGAGHWPTAAFLHELHRHDYAGFCSVGVYNSRLSRRKCITHCMDELKSS
ncbi:MAG: sugar phosphate isomerase/epimerase family protein [Kiritimatiellota bacterium]|nr:sugar phosphate isomerase/epimerase family protein [Kiritimatiellota bacterium]